LGFTDTAPWIQRFFFTALAQKAVTARRDEALCGRLIEHSKSEAEMQGIFS
jgi:hypothetical protein